jgi:C1A family cysteine protease
MAKLKFQDLQAAIQAQNASWVAGETGFEGFSDAQIKSLLGAIPPGSPPTEAQKENSKRVALVEHESMSAQRSAAAYPPVKDWRNVSGQNYVTPIRDQGGCGSCVAFGCLGVVESMIRISKGAGYVVDLSEAHLFYCLKGDPNGCVNGWWPGDAYPMVQNPGVALENYFPYVGSQQACAVATGWENQKVQITGFQNITGVVAIKDWIANKGPVSACFEVFDDFYSYRSGVYRHVMGGSVGWHCVEIVGYDDNQQCWIAKNSWGANRGENGFYRIGYGECSIELYGMWGVTGVIDSGWFNNKRIQGLWAINEDHNAWALIEGEGWKRIFPGNHNAFFSILTQLIAAKNKNTPVNVRIENGQIVEVYA